LDLTEEQRTSVKQMMDEHREATKALREENRNTHRRMRELMESENPDALALGELMLSGRRVMDQLRQAQGDLEQRFIGLLDAEQKTQYEALKKMQGRLGRGDRPFRGRRGAGPRQ
jgi:protein CpxP